jgi:NTE family protein
MDVATNQARALRKRALIDDFIRKTRTGTYWGIRTEITAYGLPDALPVPLAKTQALAALRTRLNPFSEEEQGELINWGYAVCDAAMRRHVLTGPVPPPAWPVPAYALNR